jgi:hypothetical protein
MKKRGKGQRGKRGEDELSVNTYYNSDFSL